MKKTIVILCLAALVYACKPSTEITGTWMNPRLPSASYEQISVAALTNNINAKTTVENDLQAALTAEGISVSKSMDILPPNFTDDHDDKEDMLTKFRGTGADAILTVSLIDKETETRYVPGSYGYEPMARYNYYGAFWGYYSFWYPRIYSPGYYTTDKTYFIETNLYDINTEELIWSAQSETYNPADLPSFSKEFAETIAREMREAKLFGSAIVREND